MVEYLLSIFSAFYRNLQKVYIKTPLKKVTDRTMLFFFLSFFYAEKVQIIYALFEVVLRIYSVYCLNITCPPGHHNGFIKNGALGRNHVRLNVASFRNPKSAQASIRA